jgi:anoctamin-10
LEGSSFNLENMHPRVDLVISFRITPRNHSKKHLLDHANKADRQYANLRDTLSNAGLRVTGRRGENRDHIIMLVSCPQVVLNRLVRRER